MIDALAYLRSLREAGWISQWEPEIGFITAQHPKGGRRSVLEIRADDFRALGPLIADLLNGGGAHG